jgi:hypothetical protein
MTSPEFKETQKARRKGRGDFRDLKKHFVRVNGWLPAFQHHAHETHGQVRYFTLCAKEAIDVRYFAQKGVLSRNPEANLYPSLTFVEADEEDYAIIAETLGRTRLAIRARLEETLLNHAHPSHDELRASFPYHIINLDFCGDIVPKGDHPYSETIQCLDKVVELQRLAGAGPWHLFLTFRAQRTQANDDANAQLRDMVEGNFNRDALRQAYGNRPIPKDLLRDAYPEFLRISIAKYLAHTAKNHGYVANVESSWVYGRHQGAYHIVKLVTKLVPLRASNALPNPHAELAAYEASVSAIFGSHPTDVDAVISGAEDTIRTELQPVINELEKLGIVAA